MNRCVRRVVVRLAIALGPLLACAACGPSGDERTPVKGDVVSGPGELEAAMRAGVASLARATEPFSYLLGDVVHRRFGVHELADRHQKYAAEVRARDSPQLRVFERIVRSDARVDAADLEALRGEHDRITGAALHCQQQPLPPGYAASLRAGAEAGAYGATHVLLALIWLEENGCEAPVDLAFEAATSASVAELVAGDGLIGDLELEAGALLAHRDAANVPPRLIARVLDAQLPDGSFSYAPGGTKANWHATALAVWLMGGILHPGARAPSVVQGPR